jgi:hypothetical protein
MASSDGNGGTTSNQHSGDRQMIRCDFGSTQRVAERLDRSVN